MNRDDAMMLMHRNLYRLLGLMMSMHRRWMPNTGYPRRAAGLATGGVVGYETAGEMEDEGDVYAARALEASFDELTPAERICIEMVIGTQPWVWTARPGVMEAAIAKLEKKLREIGAM